MMSTVNDTKFPSTVFFLTGIRGHEDIQLWVSIPFCIMYVISIAGNSVILFTVKTDPSLHEPMYIFLSMLALTDLAISIGTVPTTLGVFLFNSKEINLDACFAQLFFINSLSIIESFVLFFMAFDRFVAISYPLRYTSILTQSRIVKIGLVCVLRGAAVVLPLPLLLSRYQYCQDNVLSRSYCLHEEVMKLACSDIRINSLYGLAITVATVGVDSLLILVSYVMILRTVLSITSHVESLRALNTCVSHLCVVLIFYVPGIGLALLKRFGNPSPLLQILMGYIYLLVPPAMNPIVYSMKNEHLRSRIIRMFIK